MSASRTFARLALGAAVVAALVVVFAPTYSSCTSGHAACHGASALAVNGPWIFVVVSVPVVLALIPVLINRPVTRVVATVLLWLFCVVALLTIGIFFLPAAILMTIAASRGDPVASVDAPFTDR
ncbi:MAG TPA: hypothetical protein VHW68_04185 [Actinomycetota bacterium]|jgi:hypothetical protein|nr:hypothetical protein [Actinomycetota bacterium]